MATTSIGCQVPGCTYKAENASEAVAIAMLTSHNNVHQGGAVRNRAPKLEPPIIKQDASYEEWQTFSSEALQNVGADFRWRYVGADFRWRYGK